MNPKADCMSSVKSQWDCRPTGD